MSGRGAHKLCDNIGCGKVAVKHCAGCDQVRWCAAGHVRAPQYSCCDCGTTFFVSQAFHARLHCTCENVCASIDEAQPLPDTCACTHHPASTTCASRRCTVRPSVSGCTGKAVATSLSARGCWPPALSSLPQSTRRQLLPKRVVLSKGARASSASKANLNRFNRDARAAETPGWLTSHVASRLQSTRCDEPESTMRG
jgi:hypothetical protein